jgi:hypothetical protein
MPKFPVFQDEETEKDSFQENSGMAKPILMKSEVKKEIELEMNVYTSETKLVNPESSKYMAKMKCDCGYCAAQTSSDQQGSKSLNKRTIPQTPLFCSAPKAEFEENKENWDISAKGFSNNPKKVQKGRIPLNDITATYQSRIAGAVAMVELVA